MQCFTCASVTAHPATGAQLSANVVVCRECTIEFWRWFRSRMGNKPGRDNFCEAAFKWIPK